MDAVTRAILNDLTPALDDLVARKIEQILATHRLSGDGERLLTITQTAERLAESETSARRRIADGSLPHVLVPGRVAGSYEKRVRQVDLDHFIASLAGNRRAPTNTSRRAPSRKTKRSSARAPRSLDQLVQERLSRSGTVPSGRPSTKTAQERA